MSTFAITIVIMALVVIFISALCFAYSVVGRAQDNAKETARYIQQYHDEQRRLNERDAMREQRSTAPATSKSSSVYDQPIQPVHYVATNDCRTTSSYSNDSSYESSSNSSDSSTSSNCD